MAINVRFSTKNGKNEPTIQKSNILSFLKVILLTPLDFTYTRKEVCVSEVTMKFSYLNIILICVFLTFIQT